MDIQVDIQDSGVVLRVTGEPRIEGWVLSPGALGEGFDSAGVVDLVNEYLIAGIVDSVEALRIEIPDIDSFSVSGRLAQGDRSVSLARPADVVDGYLMLDLEAKVSFLAE